MAVALGTCEWASTMGPAYSASAGTAVATSAATTSAQIAERGIIIRRAPSLAASA